MTELAPSTLLYSQAIALLEQFKADYVAGKLKTATEISESIRDIVSRYADGIGKPTLKFEPLEKGEPPLSSKMNEFINALETDVNIMQDQLDVLKAGAIFVHNFITTEMMRLQNQTAQVANKVKTLQLYSSGTDINIITFGDHFINDEFIDKSLVTPDESASLLSPGLLTLGRDQDSISVIETANVKVLPSSNGFLGNNQEILDPSTATVNPATKEKIYTFVAEQAQHNQLADVIDGEPNTWLEYENYLVSEDNKARALNYNFTYLRVDEDQDNKQEYVSWANGPEDGILKLSLEFDLKTVKTINNIAYTPFGLRGNTNHPVKVTSVQVSGDGTSWDIVQDQNVWVGTDANLQTSRDADNVVIGTAVWTFRQTEVRYIRINIEQHKSIPCNIGHLYYETAAPTGTGGTGKGTRVEGPIPPIDDPARYYDANTTVQGNIIKKYEYFKGQRWAIGVRDIAVDQLTYKTTSVMVSKRFHINGVIDQVALEADIFIPDNFDSNSLWVRFYISPDEGITWIPISRIQDDIFDIKEIIVFNDPLPKEFQDPGKGYYTVKGTVNSLRFKIELSRPADKPSSSPIVKSYKLKVRRR